MSGSGKDFAVEDFKKICRNEFGYLLNDFGFREVTLPLGEFENEFKIRFVRQDLTVIVEGIHYGTGAMVYLAELEHPQWLMLAAKSILAMLILLPMITLETLERVLGRDALRRLVFRPMDPAQPG